MFRLRFGLGTAMLLLVAVSCVLAWVTAQARQAKRQQKAVAALEELGALVEYDYEVDENGNLTGSKLPSPSWLSSMFGMDFSSRVVEVSFAHCQQPQKIDDVTLAWFDDLPTLRRLDLQFTAISGKGLVHLTHLNELTTLNLGDTDLSDSGMKQISQLMRLQWLSLRNTRLSDADIEHVSRLTNLITLNISGTNVADTGLLQLTSLTSLEYMFARDTKISRQGSEQFAKALPGCHVSR